MRCRFEVLVGRSVGVWEVWKDVVLCLGAVRGFSSRFYSVWVSGLSLSFLLGGNVVLILFYHWDDGVQAAR